MSLRKDGTGRDLASPPFDRVLVANRGEIALRVMRACRDLGCEAVAVFSDADADARHVRAADQAVRIGPAPAGGELPPRRRHHRRRQGDRCRRHPSGLWVPVRAAGVGRGVRSGRHRLRRARRRRRCSASATSSHARRAATRVGVPVVPGTLEPAADRAAGCGWRRSSAEAESIGFPVLVKAAAGGGGRGMRAVDRSADLPAALVGRLARGDGRVRRRQRLPRAAASRGPATSRSSCSATRGARSSRSASGTARSSGATRSWSRRLPRQGSTPSSRRRAARDGDRRGASRRAAQRRDRRVPRRPRRRVLVPGGQRAAAGRARGDRARDRPRPRRRSSSGSQPARPSVRRSCEPRRKPHIPHSTRSRFGSPPRTRRGRSPRCPVASGAGGRRPAGASAWTTGSRTAPGSAATTTHCWASSWWSTPIGERAIARWRDALDELEVDGHPDHAALRSLADGRPGVPGRRPLDGLRRAPLAASARPRRRGGGRGPGRAAGPPRCWHRSTACRPGRTVEPDADPRRIGARDAIDGSAVDRRQLGLGGRRPDAVRRSTGGRDEGRSAEPDPTRSRDRRGAEPQVFELSRRAARAGATTGSGADEGRRRR